ncbi:hypothetical protein G7Y79_00021g050900 [Physcia stellaris]|nr:hypothetical protein G7Y79_00021g050900 [Physcia stellaris]
MDDDEVQIPEDEALKAFLPQGFGKQTKETDVARQIERSKRDIGQNAIKAREVQGDQSADGDSNDDDDDLDEEDEFPVSHEIVLKTHERSVTTMSVDPSGSRLITGSTDCTVKLHDFSSMTPTTLRAFKSVDPTATKTSANSETHPIHHVAFNPNSPSQVLIIPATPQAKIFSRDGEELLEFVKGDMYLRDMHNTKGHISEISTGPGILPTRISYDGSLVMWGGDGPYSRPSGEIREAHKKDTWTGGIDISADGRTVVTRGGDDTIKLWDTRKFKQAVSTVEHPSTSDQFANTDIRFSPNSSSVITGSATGHVHILNPATLKPELVTPVTPGSPLTTVLWHHRLNQILTGSANAETHVLYNPKTSQNGAVMIMSKAPKRRHIDDDPTLTTDVSQGLSGDSIVNPNGLLTGANDASASYAARHPTVGMTASGRSRDPRRPHIPMTTPFAKSQPDEQHIKNNIPLSSMRDEDPREALLKYAEKAEKDPMFTNAWKKTQPKTLYADISDEEEEPDKKKVKRT